MTDESNLEPDGPVIAPLNGWYLVVSGTEHRMVQLEAGQEIVHELVAPMWITHMGDRPAAQETPE